MYGASQEGYQVMRELFYLICTIISIVGIVYIVFTSIFTVTITDREDEEE